VGEPGSRKCTWLSITPGSTCRPWQSTTSAAATPTSADASDAAAGDRDVAHALAVVIDDGRALEDQIEGCGHASSSYSGMRP